MPRRPTRASPLAHASSFARGREPRRTYASPSRVAILVALGAAFFARASAAQTRVTTPGALNRYEPAERGSEWFQNDSLDLRGKMRPAAGLTLDYAHVPYELLNLDGSQNTAVVSSSLYLHAGASLVLFDRVRFAASLPIALAQSGTSTTLDGAAFVAPSSAAVGDLRLGGDVRLVGAYGDAFTLALGTQLWLPTGSANQYVGDGAARLGGHLAAAGDIGLFVYAASLGLLYRANDDAFASHPRGNEMDFAFAAGARLLGKRLVVGPELWGGTNLTSKEAFFDTRSTPSAAVLGAHYTFHDFRFGLGAGPGLSHAAGTGKLRALASIEWAPGVEAPPPPPDKDGDGVADVRDACPDAPGPETDDPKTRGCPLPKDQDADGVNDGDDACVDVRGVATHDPKTNGCPPDKDGDQVDDASDACPDVAGVRTDDPKTNGCPLDKDDDGVPDDQDACIDVAGVKTSDPKTNGCPADTDGDGVVDPEDACPKEPGPKSSDPKTNGCPMARVDAGQVKITEQFKFKTGSAALLPESQPVVLAVAAVMKDHPDIQKLRVEGHTDDVGTPAGNKALSQARAAAVVAALTKAGVEKKRLAAQGFGQERPLAGNDTEAGRAENRRVELHVE